MSSKTKTLPDHFRLEREISEEGIRIVTRKFRAIRETPSGYWVVRDHVAPLFEEKEKRWVSKTSLRRHCYPSIQDALKSLEHRNSFWLSRLEFNIAVAKHVEASTDKLRQEVARWDSEKGGEVHVGKPAFFDQVYWD